jgi:hypothetical protein
MTKLSCEFADPLIRGENTLGTRPASIAVFMAKCPNCNFDSSSPDEGRRETCSIGSVVAVEVAIQP